jgi:hypothetical protein
MSSGVSVEPGTVSTTTQMFCGAGNYCIMGTMYKSPGALDASQQLTPFLVNNCDLTELYDPTGANKLHNSQEFYNWKDFSRMYRFTQGIFPLNNLTFINDLCISHCVFATICTRKDHFSDVV